MKPVPYFPLYAANFLASKPFRLMTIEERGLWITIQMECWVNGSVPSDLKDLAQYLGVSHDAVQRSFTQKQLSFLQKIGQEFKSPELEEYRQGYLEAREKQRIGGLKGAERKRQKQSKETLAVHSDTEGVPQGQPKSSLDYVNSDSFKSNQLVGVEVTNSANKEWIDEYNNTPDLPNPYLRASKG